MTIDQFIKYFPDARRVGAGYTVRCPAHDDREPSMSVNVGDNGGVVFHCHANCTPESVVTALGLKMGDLHNGTGNGSKNGAAIVATYDYVDENGHLLFQAVRYEGKKFSQRRPDVKGGWIGNLTNTRRVLYRLPEVVARNFALICEGEKDCDTARDRLELTATCNPMGAGKWRAEYNESLREKTVRIIADADKPGREHAQQVAASLSGKAASVKVIELPGNGKDLTDWVAAGGTTAALMELFANVPEWTPPVTPAGSLDTVIVRECFADITAKPLEWDWPDRIPRAKITIFSGDPDLGKSTVACDVIARYTKQLMWPDGAANTTTPGDVLMLIAEDDPEDTTKPRLMAAGADLARVHLLRCVRITQGANKTERMLALDSDLKLLEAELSAHPEIKLIVVDPITNYFGRANVNRDQELRTVLVPIKELADRMDVTFIGIGHFNKRADVSALQRVSGAVAMSGVARAVWMFMRNPEIEGEYLMLLGKGNLTRKRTGLRYRIVEKTIPLADGKSVGVPRIDWQAGDATATADEAMSAANAGGRKIAKAKRFLMDFLASGERAAKEIMAEAAKLDIGRNTLFDAKKDLGINASQRRNGWWWKLPDRPDPPSV